MSRSDIVLLIYVVFLVPAMLVGFGFARRKLFVPHHKLVMTAITLINWILIGYLMAESYDRNVLPQLPSHLNFSAVFIPSLHLLFGGVAQLLATYLVIIMWFEKSIPPRFKVKNIKPYMRTTLALWLITAVLGLTTWAVFYHDFLISTPSVSTAASPTANTIDMVKGEHFQPTTLTVTVGTTVHFVNTDNMTHTASADDNSFDSLDVAPGKTFDYMFTKVGTYPFYCAYHGGSGGNGMAGVITVVAK